MGWFPSIFGSEKPSDPLGKLDPKLREFLEKESPVKYTTNQESTPTATTPPPPRQDAQRVVASEVVPEKAGVPSESLYQDGRYAHLWKNYRPLAQIESESATDHDKLLDVLEGFKERKAAIGRAALENCAIQQEEWVNCMKNGSWEDQLQMCRHQVRRFERCYTMQSVRYNGDGTLLKSREFRIAVANMTLSGSSEPSGTAQSPGDPYKSTKTSKCTPTLSTNA